jgi:hypothetical protein
MCSKAQLIILVYGISLSQEKNLCSLDLDTCLNLAENVSSSSSIESSKQREISFSKMS